MVKEATKFARELSGFSLDLEDEQELLSTQKECTFIWTNKDGEPIGVMMTYLWARKKVWLFCTEKRVRVTAVRRDPRTCIVISSAGLHWGTGKTITFKGTTKVHAYDAPEIRNWLYQDYVSKLHGKEANQERIDFFKGVLAVPERVALEFTPDKSITYDGDKMAAMTPGSSGRFDDMWK